MAVERVPAGIKAAAAKPAIERRAAAIEHFIPGFLPIDRGGSFAPETLGIGERTTMLHLLSAGHMQFLPAPAALSLVSCRKTRRLPSYEAKRRKTMANPYTVDLDRNPANHIPLTPLSFIERAAAVHPNQLAVVHGTERRSWAETYARCRRLASALKCCGIGKNDTVAMMAANTPHLLEAHFGVPMIGAVLNALNTRLDAKTIAFILEHGEAKVL